MSSGKVNQWLTLGANVGVLIGIILILIELDQNADLMRAQMTQARADNLLARYDNLVHSDHWPKISAKRRAASSLLEWLDSLSPEERERVLFTYFREVNDIRNQFYQYQEGYFPQRIWDTSSRGQIIRMIEFAVLLERPCNADQELQAELNRIAAEEGMPQCHEDKWR
jgi:hypothetical protein